MAGQRNFGIELARVIACVMIVVTHVTSTRYMSFHPSWSWLNAVLSFSRGGAVMYLMISGALLMNRQEPIGLVWKKRILRVLPPLLFWGGLYTIWSFIWGYGPKTWTELLYTEAYYHLWYLYALIGIYAFLPLLRRLYQGTTTAERWYYLAGWFLVASVWSTLKLWFSLPGDPVNFYQLMGFTGLSGYLFAGAWIYETRDRRLGLFGGLVLALVFFLMRHLICHLTWSLSMAAGKPIEGIFFDHLSPMLLLSSVSLFALLLRCREGSGNFSRWIAGTSGLTFGVYLIHPMVFEASSRAIFLFYGAWHLPWSLPINIALTLSLSFWLVKKLKGLAFFRYLL